RPHHRVHGQLRPARLAAEHGHDRLVLRVGQPELAMRRRGDARGQRPSLKSLPVGNRRLTNLARLSGCPAYQGVPSRVDDRGGGVMSVLDAAPVQPALRDLPGWAADGDEIVKTSQFDTFPSAIGFVNRAAEAAEAANPPPDIDIRWNKITCRLTSH